VADNGTPVDRVSIEIEAATSDASRKINALKNAMKGLRTETSGMSDAVVSKMQDIVRSVKQLEGANKINISSTLGKNLKALGDAIKDVPVSAVQNLTAMVYTLKAMETIGKISIPSSAAVGIKAIGDAAKDITQDSLDRLISLSYVLKAMEGIGKISLSAKVGEGLASFADAARGITGEAVENLRAMADQLVRLKGVDLSGFAAATKQAGKVRTKAQEAGDQARESKKEKSEQQSGEAVKKQLEWSYSLRENIRTIANEWLKVGRAAEKAKAAIAAMPAAVKIAVSVVRGLVSLMKTLAQAALSVVKHIAKIGVNLAKSGLSLAKSLVGSIASGIKTVGGWIGDIAKKVPGLVSSLLGFRQIENFAKSINSLLSGIGRVAFYRAIRSAIKMVTDAMKEGSENAYFFAKQYGIATSYIASSLDNLRSGHFKMSNQLGAAWDTMLATIEPVLTRIIALVTAAADAMTRLLAVFGGKGSYLKARDYTHAWADETQKGAAAAKEWKNQLLGFDEINRLNEPSGGGGGAGNLYEDYQNMFEEIKLEGGIFDEIRDKIENGDWAGLGKLLGGKFNDLINSVDFTGFGKTIGEKLSAAVETAYQFLKTADFQNLGRKLAEMLDGIGDQINFNTLGRLVTRIRTAIWDVLYGAFTNPGSMAKLAKNLSDYVLGALNEMTDWLRTLDPVEVANAIRDFFGNIKGEEIRDSFVTLVSTAWEKAIALKNELFPDGLLPTVTDAITKWFQKLDWVQISGAIREKLAGIWSMLSTVFDQIWPQTERDKFKEQVKDKLTEVLKEAMQMAADAAFEMLPRRLKILFAGEGEDTGAGFVANLEKGVSSKKGDMEAALDDSVARPVSSVIGDFLAKIFHARTAYALEADQINEISDGVTDTAITDFDTMGKDVPKSVDGMQTKLAKSTSLVSAGFEKMRSLSVKAGETMRDKVGNAWTAVSASTESMTASLQQKIGETWTAVQQNTETVWTNLQNSLQTIWSAINAAASSTWNTLKTNASDAWNTIKMNAETAWNAIRTVAETAWGAISAAASTAWGNISAAANSAWGSLIQEASSAAGSIIGIGESMAQGIGNAMSNVRGFLSDALDYARDAGSRLADSLGGVMDTARDVIRNVRDTVSDWVTPQVTVQRSQDPIDMVEEMRRKLRGMSHAEGGFVEEGPFFMNRGEIAGTFSNGKTVVANNRQITEGIAEATYGAFIRAMSDSGTGSGDRTVVINLDGREIARTTTKYQRQFARAAG